VSLCFISPRVRKIRNEASSCPGIFSRTLRFYYVASSPGSPLPHLLDGHRKLVGCNAIPARSCTGLVRYHWGRFLELKVPPVLSWGLLKRTCVFSFIEFVFVETNQLFGSNPNVILTLQTCGQRSGMAAASKRRALAFYFPVLIWYMFLLSECKRE